MGWYILGIILIIGALALNAGVIGEPAKTHDLAHWMFWIGVIILIFPLLIMLGVFSIVAAAVASDRK